MTTVLSAGDIAFTAYQSDNPDRVDFVLLVDVEIGTEIVFTDSGWTAAGAFRDSEGEAVWRAPADLSAGTVVSLGEDDLGSIALAAAGDQIIAFQGSIASPSFIAMIQMNGDFDDDSTSSNTSTLPADLTEGTHALAIAPEVDSAFYDGSVTSGSRSELLAAINDPSNWVGSNTPQDAEMFVTSEDFGGDTPPPAVVINEIDSDTAGADSAEFVELFGAPDQALDGLSVVLFNGNGDVAYEAFDLDGQTLDDSGYFVLGNSAVANVDLTFANGSLQNGADAVALFQADAADFSDGTSVTNVGLVDAIVYDTDDLDDSGLLDALSPDGTQFDEDGEGDREGDSLQRLPNGTGSFAPLTPTPGTENVEPPPPDPETVAIFEIQGSGAASPLVGTPVTVEAIVTADFQDDADSDYNGFFLQEEDEDSDGDDATSDGIFVFEGANNVDVQLGDLVRVTGAVSEFNDETQISSVRSVEVIESSVGSLASPATLTFPVATTTTNADGQIIADLESYEGMLVTVPTEMTVSDLFTLGRYNEVGLNSGGRISNFTQTNAPSVAGYEAFQNDVATRGLVIDDAFEDEQNIDPIFPDGGLNADVPNVIRAGDTVSDVTGVIAFREPIFNDFNFRLIPTETPEFVTENDRPLQAPNVGGSLKIASFNVLNYFTTIDTNVGGFNGPNITGPAGDQEPRGAESEAGVFTVDNDGLSEFDRQEAKIVSAINELDADVLGLVEIENDPAGSDAISALVDAVNTSFGGSRTYDFVDTGPVEGAQGGAIEGDAIKVGFIYDTQTVSATGDFAILDETVDARFQTVATQRPAIAQTFTELASGESFTAAINHFKSKGSVVNGENAIGDGQGNNNPTRTEAAEALVDWLETDPTASNDDDFIILGDLNAYLMEDPIQAILDGADDVRGTDDDYASLVGADDYSFGFPVGLNTVPQIQTYGTLDYALVSGSLQEQVTATAEWHINADEAAVLDYNLNFQPSNLFDTLYAPDPFRASDHDPLIVGLDFESEAPLNLIAGDDGRNLLGGTREDDEIDGKGGNDLIFARAGNDVVIGGPGNDRINAGAGDDTIRPETGRDRIRGGPGEDTLILGDGDRDSIWRDFREDEDAGLLLTYKDLLTDPDTLTIDASRIELVDVRRDLQVRVDLDGDGDAETLATTLSRSAGASIEDVIINPLDTLVS